MEPVDRHPFEPDVSFDGGDLDCGNGLLLLIRQHMDPMARGQLLESRSVEISVDEDFPAWCRMTGNELVSFVKRGRERSFLVCKGSLADRVSRDQAGLRAVRSSRAGPTIDSGTRNPVAAVDRRVVEVTIPTTLPAPGPAPEILPLS